MFNSFNFVPIDLYTDNKNKKKPVLMTSKDGKICHFPSVRDASKMMRIPSPNIVACLKGRIKTAGGYFWKYEE